MLESILFVLYTADLLQLIRTYNLTPHGYADDTQILGICHHSTTDELQRRMSDCIDDVSTWMKAKRLLLNHNKTEVLWCSSSRRQHQIPTAFVRVGTSDVQPVSVVRNLGVYINSDVTLRAHVTATVRACFAALRQIRSVRQCLPRDAVVTLVVAVVISKVDYCNSVMAGASPAVGC